MSQHRKDSIRQLQTSVPKFEFYLYPEWHNWLDGFLSSSQTASDKKFLPESEAITMIY